jgi:hypothetical protein
MLASSSVTQRQNQSQQNFQQCQTTNDGASQIVYQPSSQPVTTMSLTQPQNTNMSTHSPFPTWSPEPNFPIQRNDMSISSRPRAHSIATHSLKNLNRTSRIQTSFLSTPIILDPGMILFQNLIDCLLICYS